MPWCHLCSRYFSTDRGLDQHLEHSAAHAAVYECQTCDRCFSTERAVDQHMDAKGHWTPSYECDTCTKRFSTQAAVESHMNAKGHWTPSYECDTCTRGFSTQAAVESHMDAKGHWDHYCHGCERGFNNANSLRMHLNSRIHRGASVICPFCRRSFVSASGVSHHLETGSCPNATNTNRDTIHRAIQSRDPHGSITKKQLEWYSEFEVTEDSWNGYGYECYLCGNVYNTLRALNLHVNSGPHREKIYHCPNPGCSTEFVSLGGLFNHLESESCGYMRFERVRKSVTGILDGSSRLIGF